MRKRRSNRVKEMKSQWKRRHLKCETNRSVMDILWQPLVNTLKETHILFDGCRTFTNFRKKKHGWLAKFCPSTAVQIQEDVGYGFFSITMDQFPSRRRFTLPPNHPCSWAIPSQWPNFDPDLAYLCTSLPKKTWYELFAPPEKNPKLLQWKGNSSTKGHVWFLLLRIGVCHNHMKQP